MRQTGFLLLGAGILVAALNGCGHFQYTAGVCDCDPPPVESAYMPYTGRPQAHPVTAVAPGKVVEPIPAPKVIDPKKPPKVVDPGKPPKVIDNP